MTTHNTIQEKLDKPLISIIMPAYNAESYIANAIHSVQQQTYINWELLVIDDGSTDRTIAIVEALEENRIRLLKLEHTGRISIIRNIGLKEAKGEFIAFLDSDDLYEPHALESLQAHLTNYPECNAVYGYFRWIDENNHFLDIEPWLQIDNDGSLFLKEGSEHTWENILNGRTPTWLQALLFRKSLLNRIPKFSENILINEDYLFFVELFLEDFEAVPSIPKYIFRYRNYMNSITKNPDRFNNILDNQKSFFNYIFEHQKLLTAVPQLNKSLIATHHLHSIAITRLMFNQPGFTRKTCLWAFHYDKVSLQLWFRYFLHLLILSFIPFAIRSPSINAYKALKLLVKENLRPYFMRELAKPAVTM